MVCKISVWKWKWIGKVIEGQKESMSCSLQMNDLCINRCLIIGIRERMACMYKGILGVVDHICSLYFSFQKLLVIVIFLRWCKICMISHSNTRRGRDSIRHGGDRVSGPECRHKLWPQPLHQMAPPRHRRKP